MALRNLAQTNRAASRPGVSNLSGIRGLHIAFEIAGAESGFVIISRLGDLHITEEQMNEIAKSTQCTVISAKDLDMFGVPPGDNGESSAPQEDKSRKGTEISEDAMKNDPQFGDW